MGASLGSRFFEVIVHLNLDPRVTSHCISSLYQTDLGVILDFLITCSIQFNEVILEDILSSKKSITETMRGNWDKHRLRSRDDASL